MPPVAISGINADSRIAGDGVDTALHDRVAAFGAAAILGYGAELLKCHLPLPSALVSRRDEGHYAPENLRDSTDDQRGSQIRRPIFQRIERSQCRAALWLPLSEAIIISVRATSAHTSQTLVNAAGGFQ
jgi:hypothetical protein